MLRNVECFGLSLVRFFFSFCSFYKHITTLRRTAASRLWLCIPCKDDGAYFHLCNRSSGMQVRFYLVECWALSKMTFFQALSSQTSPLSNQVSSLFRLAAAGVGDSRRRPRAQRRLTQAATLCANASALLDAPRILKLSPAIAGSRSIPVATGRSGRHAFERPLLHCRCSESV